VKESTISASETPERNPVRHDNLVVLRRTIRSFTELTTTPSNPRRTCDAKTTSPIATVFPIAVSLTPRETFNKLC
jgi:hypothetical protein